MPVMSYYHYMHSCPAVSIKRDRERPIQFRKLTAFHEFAIANVRYGNIQSIVRLTSNRAVSPNNLRTADRSASSSRVFGRGRTAARFLFHFERRGIPRDLPQWFRTAMLVNTGLFDRLAVAKRRFPAKLPLRSTERRKVSYPKCLRVARQNYFPERMNIE